MTDEQIQQEQQEQQLEQRQEEDRLEEQRQEEKKEEDRIARLRMPAPSEDSEHEPEPKKTRKMRQKSTFVQEYIEFEGLGYWLDLVFADSVPDGDKWIKENGEDGKEYRVGTVTESVRVSVETTTIRVVG